MNSAMTSLLEHFTFAWPWLWLILPLPLLIAWLPPVKTGEVAALRVPFFATMAAVAPAGKAGANRGVTLLLVCVWILLVAAAARPQWLGEAVELPQSGRDLWLAVDISQSMQAQDMSAAGRPVNRLMAVQAILSEFIDRREGDRVGLILFGKMPYVQAPLTFDRATVKTLLNEAEVGMAGQYTAVGDAIGLGLKRLRESHGSYENGQQRVIVMLTDGADNASNIRPAKAAELAAQAGVRVHTIAFGADQRQTGLGLFSATVRADMDEKTLKKIADTTGGRYFRATDAVELKNIYRVLDELEPTEGETRLYRPITSLAHGFLAVALFFSVLLVLAQIVRWQKTDRQGMNS